MDSVTAILAAPNGAGELLDFLPILVIGGLIFLGNIIRKKMEEAEAQKQRKKAEERRDNAGKPPRPAKPRTLPGSLREVIAQATATPEAPPEARPEPTPVPTPAPPAAAAPPARRRRRQAEPKPQPKPQQAAPSPKAAQGAATAPMREPPPATATPVDLSTRDKLRQAIIAHEIFGLPKSLRKDEDSWDRA